VILVGYPFKLLPCFVSTFGLFDIEVHERSNRNVWSKRNLVGFQVFRHPPDLQRAKEPARHRLAPRPNL
jgi:hypothetical protein